MASSPKFSQEDEQVIVARNAFFESADGLSPKFAIDNWALFAGEVPISTQLARYEIVKSTVSVPGHILEFGVFNGANLSFMAKLMKILAPNDLKKLYGFDSWQGLSEFDGKDGDAVEREGHYQGQRGLFEQMTELHNLSDRLELVDGLIEETLPAHLAKNPHHIFSLIYIDTDLYASTKLILEECWSRLSPGGVVVFDEGYHDLFPGEGAAMNEFLATVPGTYDMESLPFARQPMVWVRKR